MWKHDEVLLEDGKRSSDGERSCSVPRADENSCLLSSGGPARLPPPAPPHRSSTQKLEANAAASDASKSAFSGTFGTSAFGTTVVNMNGADAGEMDDSGHHRGGGGAGGGGSSSSSARHQHVVGITDEALRQFDDAMSLIDPKEKEGWTKAQAHCPSAALQHECCPCYFLHACQFNPWDAAVRMCAYWEERIDLFEDRAFEAMTIGSDSLPPTGLTRGDVEILETGAILILPKDREGRSVLFMDEAKLEPHMLEQPKSRLRVLWYMHHAYFTSGGASAYRLVGLFGCYKPPSGGKYGAATWQFSAGSFRLLAALPVAFEAFHLLTLQTKSGTGTLVQIMLSATAAMMGSYFSSHAKVHHGTAKRGTFADPVEEETQAKSTLLKKLLEAGFTKKGLPDWAGGAFGDQAFRDWAKRRRRFEQRAFWTAEQRTQHRRNQNKAHSQHKRRRRHQELIDLQDQVTILESTNARSRNVHMYLEQLVALAVETVSQHEAQPQPATAGLVPKIDWFGDPTGLPSSSVEAHQLSILAASLEPDPIAPFSMSVASMFHAPLGPLSLSGGEQRAAQQQAPSEDPNSHAFRAYRPILNQQESYASSSSASQQPLSSAGIAASSYPPVVGMGPSGLGTDRITSLQGTALAELLLHQENASYPTVDHSWQQPSELALNEPSDSNHTTAALLRAMFQHPRALQPPPTPPQAQQPPFFEHFSADPSGRQQVALTNEDLVPSCHLLGFHPRPSSLSCQLPGPCVGERDWTATQPPSNSSVQRSNTGKRIHEAYDDGCADASARFDLDWA